MVGGQVEGHAVNHASGSAFDRGQQGLRVGRQRLRSFQRMTHRVDSSLEMCAIDLPFDPGPPQALQVDVDLNMAGRRVQIDCPYYLDRGSRSISRLHGRGVYATYRVIRLPLRLSPQPSIVRPRQTGLQEQPTEHPPPAGRSRPRRYSAGALRTETLPRTKGVLVEQKDHV